jgi:sugar transferase (PEP-CTERM/EpsH1 system associated)
MTYGKDQDGQQQGKDPQRFFVCHIIFRLDFGGLENGLVNLINHLPLERYRHAVICLTHAADFRKRIRQPDVTVLAINKREGKDLAAYGRVWRLVRNLRPDIVHTRNLPALDMLAPARLAGVRRLVHSEHGLDVTELDGRHWKYNQMRRLSRLVVSHYVCVSRDLARWLHTEIGIPIEKMSVIHNGVDTDLYRQADTQCNALPPGFVPPGAFVIGAIGRLEPVKDQLTLTRAFTRMLELRPTLRRSVRLVVIGDGSLRSEIERVLARAGANGLAWLPGFGKDVLQLYRAFSVFALPSRREGISNTILEAMASGLPVIATRVGGNVEIVDDGRTGQLIPPGDPDAMTHALLAYIDKPALAQVHGAAGRKRVVKEFSLSAMVESYDRLYKSVVSR